MNSDDEHWDEPTKKSKHFHFPELQYEDEPYYVLKTSEIFPLDFDINDRGTLKNNFIWPEFLIDYDKPLKADTKKQIVMGVESQSKEESDALEIHEATRYLKGTTISNLVNLLNNLTVIPIHS